MGLGEDHGGFSPFDIRFIFTQDDEAVSGFEPFDPKAVACYEAISVSDFSLSSVFAHLLFYSTLDNATWDDFLFIEYERILFLC